MFRRYVEMLIFDLDEVNTQKLAIHYAKKINDDYVVEFVSSNAEITTADEALSIARAFWQITDLAINDNEKDAVVEGVVDLEFWMHKLFNKVSGYLKKNGYGAQWDQASDEYEST